MHFLVLTFIFGSLCPPHPPSNAAALVWQTGDLRAQYMSTAAGEGEEQELLGNDLDQVDIGPQFQV